MSKTILLIGILLIPKCVLGQPNTPCSNSTYNAVVANSTGSVLYVCGTNSQWGVFTLGVPSGIITLVSSGSCPTGFVEATELNGVTLVGTLAANGNVGTTGGLDNITPSGSVTAPVFTGNALSGHAHELPFQIPSTITTRLLASAIFGTGTSRAATSVSANGVANTTSAAVALTQSVSAGIPSGTNSVPTFSGNLFDNRSAFIRVIFCRKS